MEALKRLTLALAVLALGGVGCGDDDGGDDDTNNNVDAGQDGSIDGSTDGSKPDGSTSADGSTYSCTTYTAPTATMCGGNHCDETAAELKASVGSGAACKADAELDQFCQLTSVAAVQTCIIANFAKPDPVAETKTCATAALPDYSSACLDCFVASAACAAQNCAGPCLANPQSAACDNCRLGENTAGANCIADFYACSGIPDPIPGD